MCPRGSWSSNFSTEPLGYPDAELAHDAMPLMPQVMPPKRCEPARTLRMVGQVDPNSVRKERDDSERFQSPIFGS